MLKFKSHCFLSQRPLLLPSFSPIRPSPPRQAHFPLAQFSDTHHFKFSSIKRWKVSCFRREESPLEISKHEFVDDILHEDALESEFTKPSSSKGDLVSNLREAVDAVRGTINKPWTVPWTVETILQVTLLWMTAFWFVGHWLVPTGAWMMGYNNVTLTYRGQAFLSLLIDVIEGFAGAAILHHCLSRFRPLPSEWFKFSLKGDWLLDVVVGCLMFPLINRLSQINLDLLPILPSNSVSSIEQSIIAKDPVAMAIYAVLLMVCAPLWEELVFRGFLLPSLTRYMPIWGSILVSSVGFAVVHWNIYRVLPLFLIGLITGVLYTRSKNLFPSIVLHSLWNFFVFVDLMK
ncbi:hypothetical protein DCAR_0209629 [Daucus carota subsp. sativus]|uniref:CAAX prenyl protease 2/Lysostaphin resistance protein A-like domain-containing protein n=1 Tax=Daucus carota subsp. sativus TaxID=79200 RepID=A0AAF0WM20_DAUCS|nr:PREDICTED: uncharacterized protein LOC108206788 [Daucus carota subsp. sativus]WOG90385.1 hypothetical protein DCAR_0209629 [Daucus carota subsp. sativus]